MLTRSLCCFKGISPEAEVHLWHKGCLSWRHLAMMSAQLFSPQKKTLLYEQIPLFNVALEANCVDFFVNRLPRGYKLRILPQFNDKIAYLDIETTGLGPKADLTVIGLYWQGTMHTFIKGANLNDFLKLWGQIGVLVTFNGSRFDLPVLMQHFGLSTHPPHIDLFDEARQWGFTGGLKAIETKIGIIRTQEESGDGEEAVALWNDYANEGNQQSLEKLIVYNTRDVLSLQVLAQRIWKMACQNYTAPHPKFEIIE